MGGRFVEALADLLADNNQGIGSGLDCFRVGAFQGAAQVGQFRFEGGLIVVADLFGLLGEQLLGLVDERVGVIANLGFLFAFAVLLGVQFRVFDHLINDVGAERTLASDGHRLLFVGGLVFGAHMHDAVGVDVERDLDLRRATGRGRQVDELELAERLVVGGHVPLALEHMDLDRRLVVVCGRERLALAGRDSGVAFDQAGHHCPLGLDAKRQRRHIEQQHVFDFAFEHAGLHGRTDRHDFVGIHRLVRFLACHFQHQLGDCGHPRRSTDEHDMVDCALGEPGVFDGRLERDAAAVEQVGGEFTELGAGQFVVEMQRPGCGRGDERKVDLRRLGLRQFDLGLLSGFLEPLRRHRVFGQINPVVALE